MRLNVHAMMFNNRYTAEKLDGIRGNLNGGRIYSRESREIKQIQTLLSLLSNIVIDGEIW